MKVLPKVLYEGQTSVGVHRLIDTGSDKDPRGRFLIEMRNTDLLGGHAWFQVGAVDEFVGQALLSFVKKSEL